MRDDALNASGDDPQLQLFAADTSALCRAYLVQQIEIFEKKMKNKVKKKKCEKQNFKKIDRTDCCWDCVWLCEIVFMYFVVVSTAFFDAIVFL